MLLFRAPSIVLDWYMEADAFICIGLVLGGSLDRNTFGQGNPGPETRSDKGILARKTVRTREAWLRDPPGQRNPGALTHSDKEIQARKPVRTRHSWLGSPLGQGKPGSEIPPSKEFLVQ